MDRGYGIRTTSGTESVLLWYGIRTTSVIMVFSYWYGFRTASRALQYGIRTAMTMLFRLYWYGFRTTSGFASDVADRFRKPVQRRPGSLSGPYDLQFPELHPLLDGVPDHCAVGDIQRPHQVGVAESHLARRGSYRVRDGEQRDARVPLRL